jgi:hypothetical protein
MLKISCKINKYNFSANKFPNNNRFVLLIVPLFYYHVGFKLQNFTYPKTKSLRVKLLSDYYSPEGQVSIKNFAPSRDPLPKDCDEKNKEDGGFRYQKNF